MTPYQKIMRAASKKRGLRLSAEEVRQLSSDDAISQVAEHDDRKDAGEEYEPFPELPNVERLLHGQWEEESDA